MKLTVDYQLDYYDGPTMFFGTLDGKTVWVEADLSGDSLLADNRRFTYWEITPYLSLAGNLNRDPSGQFTSDDVGRVV